MSLPLTTRRRVSFIFPIFNEEENIPLLFERICEVTAHRPDLDYEFLFVNDGSSDSSISLLHDLERTDRRVRVLDFSRNFGHQIAVTAGLDNCSGDAAIIMDADLQDPPEVSLELIDKWDAGYAVAYAQRRTRRDTFFKRVTAAAFYRVIGSLSEVEIPRNVGDFRLIDRKVIDALSSMREHSRYVRGLVSFVGYKQIAVPFDRDERHAGTSGYPLSKMIRFAFDGISSFSTVPLKITSAVGYFLSFISLLGILYALGVKTFSPETTIEGWTFMVISVLFIGGVQLIFLGIIGSYLGRAYIETQNRPLYFVESLTPEQPRE